MSRTAAVLNRIASKIKKSPYELDHRIPETRLIQLAADRAVMRGRAYLRLGHRRRHAFVGPGVEFRSRGQLHIGSGVTFGHGAVIDALSVDGVRLGDNVSVGRNTRIECTGNLQLVGRGLWVGDNVGLGTDCLYGCAGGVEIGSDTLIGNFVSFHSENHVADQVDTPIRLQGVSHQGISVGSDCWIGAKATILDGAQIGDGCIVAAGAVVSAGRYPAYGIYGGVPARLIRKRGAMP